MKNKPLPDAPVTTTANSEDALQFVRRLQEEFFGEKPLNERAFVEQYLDRFPRGTCAALVGGF